MSTPADPRASPREASFSAAVPQGFYNIEIMLENVARRGAEVGVCGVCMDARGFADTDLTQGCKRSALEQLTDWTTWAERTLVF